MIVRFLKSHIIETGKKLPIGKITRRGRKEAARLIANKIAEEYNGPLNHTIRTEDKMKTDLFKPKT